MKTSDDLLREASDLLHDLANGGDLYRQDQAKVTALRQQIETHFARLDQVTVPSADLASIELRALALFDPDTRTDRILDVLFPTVTGRTTFPLRPGLRQQIPNGKKMGIGVDEADYKNGGLP